MTKTKLYYAATFLSGLLLGWLAIGWWLWPVAYVGEAYTYELNQADKLRYVEACVDSFTYTGMVNPDWFTGWYGDEIKQPLEQVALEPSRAEGAKRLADKLNLVLGWQDYPVQVKAQNQASEAIPTDGLVNLAGILVLVSFVVGGFLVWRSRQANRQPAITSLEQAFVERQTTEYIPVQPKSQSSPLAHARLDFGPNHPTDQHFPIEQGGVTMGEFGVSQVEDMQAWDVWLFDPKALGTVTKVISDERGSVLDGRGEFIAWKEPFTLETPNLKMTGSAVKQLENGLSVELTVEVKDE